MRKLKQCEAGHEWGLPLLEHRLRGTSARARPSLCTALPCARLGRLGPWRSELALREGGALLA